MLNSNSLETQLKYLNLLFVLIFLNSCSTNKEIVGLYGKCKKGYLACRQIELKSNNTFEEYIWYDFGPRGAIRKGTWKKISGDTIVLNTLEQPTIPKTSYVGKVNPALKNQVRIQISDKNGPLDSSNIFINDRQLLKVADSNGIVQFDTKVIRNIEYGFLNQIQKIEIDNPNYTEINILTRDLDLSTVPKFITNEKMVVKRNKIMLDTSYFYKKTSLKNKQWK